MNSEETAAMEAMQAMNVAANRMEKAMKSIIKACKDQLKAFEQIDKLDREE